MATKIKIFFLVFWLLPAFAFGQVVKTAALTYTKGTSPYTPNIASSSEIRIDTATSQMYWWNRNALTWVRFQPGIDVITGGVAPAYTPRDNQSLFAINDDDELYYYDGATWNQVSGVGDDWGTEVVQRDSSLQGNGTVSSVLGIKGYDAASNNQVPSKATGGITWITPLTAEVDGSVTNEGSLSVGAGGSNSSTIVSNTSGSTAVTISGSTTALVTESGSTITVQADTSFIATVNDVNAARNRNDSTFAKTLGSYDNKRITDNVYRNGTTSFRSTDTTGIVNIYAQANPKAGIYTRYGNATSDGFLFFQLDPDGQTNNSSLGNFNFWGRNFDGANAPYSTRANHVWLFGYNTASGGGRILSTDADLHIAFESCFHRNYGNGGGIKRGWEWHIESQDTMGVVHRPITLGGTHDGTRGDIGLNADIFAFGDYQGAAKGWISFTNGTYTKGLTFLDTAILQFKYPQVGVDFLRVRNAANSADISIFRMDASNRLVITPAGNSLWTYSPEFIFNTLGTITTADGNAVQIGDATRKSYLSIYAPSTEVLRMRSNTGGSNLWSTYVNSNNIVYALPSGSNYMQFFTNSAQITGSNNRIGISDAGGSGPTARFHIRQSSDVSSGGMQLTNVGETFSVFQAVDASGRLVWYHTSGGVRMVLDQTGSLAVGTFTNPVSKLDVDGGATIGATYAGVNAAPTNGAIIEGNVGIGNNNPSQRLHVTGNARVTGAFYDSNNDAGTTGQVLKSTATGTDWQAAAQVYSFTRALPTTVNNTIWIGVLNKTGNGANVFQLDIQVQGASVSIGKTYIVSSSYNSTSNTWQTLIPVSSTGSFGGSDFAVEIRGNNNLDSLRIRRTAGTSAPTALCELRHAHGGTNTFTEITSTDNPPTITAIFSENALGQVDGRVGIGVLSPANVLDVEGAAVIGATYSGTNTAPTNGLLVEGNIAVGNTSADAKLDITGSGNTSGTNALLVENSDGTDIFIVRNDQNSSFGTTPQSTVRLTVRGSSADTTATGLDVQRSSGTPTLRVRNDGKVSVNNAFLHDALNVNGDTRTDGIVLTNQTASTSSGKLKYNNGGSNAGFLQLGDGDNATIIAPKTIQLQAIDYNVDWTTGRTKAFWTVPARYNGYKVSKCYLVVSTIGSGSNDVEIEKGGVALATQTISSSDHTVTLNNTLSTGDIFTFDVTSVGGTPSKGLFVELELATN